MPGWCGHSFTLEAQKSPVPDSSSTLKLEGAGGSLWMSLHWETKAVTTTNQLRTPLPQLPQSLALLLDSHALCLSLMPQEALQECSHPSFVAIVPHVPTCTAHQRRRMTLCSHLFSASDTQQPSGLHVGEKCFRSLRPLVCVGWQPGLPSEVCLVWANSSSSRVQPPHRRGMRTHTCSIWQLMFFILISRYDTRHWAGQLYFSLLPFHPRSHKSSFQPDHNNKVSYISSCSAYNRGLKWRRYQLISNLML